ncbi:hypothetical protein [Rhodovulum sulfidophilum]|uniref:hypothetical protein n=1 Tax=Rhodovulum sulfidophilum TaxID=35806 RepID=UPI001F21FD29|nr:hypothetical protein [Rhodovulum sulfidophilum]MCE8440717.1 hypothetical protein [Rhodovulum sulfidophilum]MCE8468993.1 hypothetical protein [Rhodovulum sulfidophilum]
MRLVRASGDVATGHCGQGENDNEACLTQRQDLPGPFDPEIRRLSLQAHEGLRPALDGSQPLFSMEYPCHAPSARRWLRMTAMPVPGGAFGAVIRHIEITPWVRKTPRT